MKNIKIYYLLTAFVLLLASCQEKEPELGSLPNKSDINYSVTQDLTIDAGGNTVILKNNTLGTVSMWDFVTGRSTKSIDTVHYAFKGEYIIKFSALTAAGIVKCDSVVVNVTQDNLKYVNDSLWNAISGGVGNEKIWLLDLNAGGICKYFLAPVYFAGDDWGYGNVCSGAGGNCWTWFPEYKGNEWMAAVGDYGTMTFNLKNGPFMIVDHKMNTGNAVQNGTYYIDAANHMIYFTDALPLNNGWTDIDFSKARIISVNENSLQLGFHNLVKPEFSIFNYIAKEYSDNWTPPPPKGDPNFDFGNQGELLSVSSSKTWKFDLQVPYNWIGLEGNMLNNWNSRADIIATGWAPYGDADTAGIMNVSIKFGADNSVVITQNDGTKQTGIYSINEKKNLITFVDITPNIPIASWVSATTTDKNQWKIVKVEKDLLTDEVKGIWFGKRDPNKSEYMAFHFLPK